MASWPSSATPWPLWTCMRRRQRTRARGTVTEQTKRAWRARSARRARRRARQRQVTSPMRGAAPRHRGGRCWRPTNLAQTAIAVPAHGRSRRSSRLPRKEPPRLCRPRWYHRFHLAPWSLCSFGAHVWKRCHPARRRRSERRRMPRPKPRCARPRTPPSASKRQFRASKASWTRERSPGAGPRASTPSPRASSHRLRHSWTSQVTQVSFGLRTGTSGTCSF
mmetsp:Transcript_15919/g.43660  ORF Transcript_15919/g.43660 Transcript_15919/m.43660 type:complete len:221 (+) Transcript_15919:669-1331(+)